MCYKNFSTLNLETPMGWILFNLKTNLEKSNELDSLKKFLENKQVTASLIGKKGGFSFRFILNGREEKVIIFSKKTNQKEKERKENLGKKNNLGDFEKLFPKNTSSKFKVEVLDEIGIFYQNGKEFLEFSAKITLL